MDTELSRMKVVVAGMLTTIFMLIFLYVYIGNQSSVLGGNLSEMQMQIDNLKKENMLLEEKIEVMSSLTTIHAKAIKKGFIDGRNTTIYL